MSAHRAGRRLPSVLVTLVLVSVAAAVLAVRLPMDGTLWYFDITKVVLPNAELWHEALRHGSVPLWIDEMGLGFPIYAEGQIGAFYPPNAVLHLLPPIWAIEASRILHLALAGVGAGLITLRLSGSRVGAIVAAAAAVLGGGVVGKLEWTNLVVAYGWLPWVLLPLIRRPAPTVTGVLVAGAALGVQGLAGHPNTWVMTGIAASVLLLATAPRPATVVRIVALGGTAAAVAAVQLLPTLALWSLSVRTSGLADWDLFSNSATVFDVLLPGFANAFMPLGPRESDFAQQWYPGGLWGVREASAYVGLPMLALIGVGVTVRRARPVVIVALAMVAIAVLGAFRPALWLETPILNGLRHPARAYMFAGLALAIVAGLGAARLRSPRVPWKAGAVPVVASVMAYSAAVALASWAPDTFTNLAGWAFGLSEDAASATASAALRTLLRPFPLVAELAMGLVALGLLALARPRRARVWVQAGAAVVAVVTLALFSPPINPVRPVANVSDRDEPYMGTVRSLEPDRFLALADPSWYEGIPNQLAAEGTRELSMFSSLDLRGVRDLVNDIRFPEVDERLAAMVGVDLLAAFGERPCPGDTVAELDNGVTMCRVADATDPPVWLPASVVGPAHRLATERSAEAIHALLGIAVWERSIDVEHAIADAMPVEVVRRTDERGTFIVDAPAPGHVWVDRAWWPGWETTVNGRPVRVDLGLAGQLVPVAAGSSTIEQAFVPREAWVGAAISLVSLGAIGIVVVVRRRRDAEPNRPFASS